MLEIHVPKHEFFNEELQEFIYTPECTLQLEHSLDSISKWEGKFKKPFLSDGRKSEEETIEYIKCMTLNSGVNPLVYKCLDAVQLKAITDYISDSMTATTFGDEGKKNKRKEIITAEIVYYWMVALQIPFECQYWHFSRLMTLIKVTNIKQNPPKKRSRKELMSRNAALNAARRKALGSKG